MKGGAADRLWNRDDVLRLGRPLEIGEQPGGPALQLAMIAGEEPTPIGCAVVVRAMIRATSMGGMRLPASRAQLTAADYMESDRPAGASGEGAFDVRAGAGVLAGADTVTLASTARSLP